MHSLTLTAAAVSTIGISQALTLSDVCTASYVKDVLPADDFYTGITIDRSSVTANPVFNTSVTNQNFYPDAVFDYCNVSFSYSHTGRGDEVNVLYWLPAPADFKNRYLSTGGSGYAINTASQSLPGGIVYGAVAGATDGGFGSFSTNADAVFLVQNGTIDYDTLFMFGYEGIHELSVIGKEFTKLFFNTTDTKLYSYYQGCSEGGREGWSQVQRYADQFDGVITGAPAFRYGFQQANHLTSNVMEKTLNYFPPTCEFEKIVNETIAACDSMDGKIDGVVARTDLCKLNFDMTTLVGQDYYCAASSGSSGFAGGPPAKSKRQMGTTPTTQAAQNGTVTATGVELARQIIDGLHDSQGRRVYLSYQPTATFEDGVTIYNNETGKWEAEITSLGGEWVARFLLLNNASSLSSLDGITYDTIKAWMILGWQRYSDTLQTTWPDLTPFHSAGGKVLHFHGESDNSIPTASSVRYHESVRQIMYPNMSYNESNAALNEWYRLYLIPGAAHCSPDPNQPNGAFPQTNLAVLIDWVEKGVVPETLNATVLSGDNAGQNGQICAWPLRPLWANNGTEMECVYDQKSIDTWHYDLDAIPLPVY